MEKEADAGLTSYNHLFDHVDLASELYLIAQKDGHGEAGHSLALIRLENGLNGLALILSESCDAFNVTIF